MNHPMRRATPAGSPSAAARLRHAAVAMAAVAALVAVDSALVVPAHAETGVVEEPAGDPTAEPVPTTEPDPTAEPVPTTEPDPTAEPVPTTEPDPTAEPDPTGEPDPTAEPDPTTEPDPDPVDEPEPFVGVPSTLLLGGATTTSVTVTWSAPVEAGSLAPTGYLVEHRLPDGEWVAGPDQPTTETVWTIGELLVATTYEVRVTAMSDALVGAGTVLVVSTAPAPSAPQDLAVAATPDSLLVTWRTPEVSGELVTDYEVQTSTDGIAWSTTTDKANARPWARVTGLAPSAGYQVRVRAVAGPTAGEWSAPVLASTAPAPSAPLALRAASVTTKSVTLKWDEPATSGGWVTGYQVQVSRDGRTWSTVRGPEGPARTRALTGLTPGTRYQVRVLAAAGSAVGVPSAAFTVTTAVAPGAPRNVRATVTSSSAQVVWDVPLVSGALVTDYTVRTSRDGRTWTTVVADGAGTRATLTGLAPGTRYYVQVVPTADETTVGAPAVTTIVTKVTTATAPRSLRATTSGRTAAALTWAVPISSGGLPVTDYVVQYSTNGYTWKTFADGRSAKTSGTISVLPPRATTYVRVAAVTAAGVGAYAVTQVTTR